MYLIKWLLFPVGGSQALSVGGVCRRCSGRRSVSGSLRGALADLGLWVQAEALWSSTAHQERPGAIQAGPRGCPTWASDAAGPAVGVSELVGPCCPSAEGKSSEGQNSTAWDAPHCLQWDMGPQGAHGCEVVPGKGPGVTT